MTAVSIPGSTHTDARLGHKSESKVFSPWGDLNNYLAMTNGGFENGTTDWWLSGDRCDPAHDGEVLILQRLNLQRLNLQRLILQRLILQRLILQRLNLQRPPTCEPPLRRGLTRVHGS